MLMPNADRLYFSNAFLEWVIWEVFFLVSCYFLYENSSAEMRKICCGAAANWKSGRQDVAIFLRRAAGAESEIDYVWCKNIILHSWRFCDDESRGVAGRTHVGAAQPNRLL
jgi:hypothetical protein